MASSTSKSNLEIVQEAYAAFNEGDIGHVTGVMDADIEWTEPEGSPYRGTYRGPNAVVESVFTPSAEDIEDFEVATDSFIDGGDSIVVLGTARGTVRATGKSLNAPFAHVLDLEDGRMTRFVDYADTHSWQQTLVA